MLLKSEDPVQLLCTKNVFDTCERFPVTKQISPSSCKYLDFFFTDFHLKIPFIIFYDMKCKFLKLL